MLKDEKEEKMKPEDLKIKEDLKFDPTRGQIDFHDLRMIILTTDSFGILFQEMIELGGENFAKVFIRESLYSWGKAAGIDDAKLIIKEFKPADDQLIDVGMAMTAGEGQVLGIVEEVVEYDKPAGKVHITGIWKNSFLAEQYLKAFGKSDKPVCRYLEGYLSGYISEVMGKNVICTETACVAAGHDACKFEIKNE
jgi:hypothetical protein